MSAKARVKRLINEQPNHRSIKLYIAYYACAGLNIKVFHQPLAHHRQIRTQGWIKYFHEKSLIPYKFFPCISLDGTACNLAPGINKPPLL